MKESDFYKNNTEIYIARKRSGRLLIHEIRSIAVWVGLVRPVVRWFFCFVCSPALGSVIRPPPADRAGPGPLKIRPTRAWRLHSFNRLRAERVPCGVRSVVAYRYPYTVIARWRYSGVTGHRTNKQSSPKRLYRRRAGANQLKRVTS